MTLKIYIKIRTNKMEENQVKQLAETLMKVGVAVSMYEAVEKAKSILSVKTQGSNILEGSEDAQENQQTRPNVDAEIKKEDATLNELMKEANVAVEEPQENKAERKDEVEEEKKVDLTKIFGNKK